MDELALLTEAGSAVAAGFDGPKPIWDAIVADFRGIGSASAWAAFLQVLMIDVVLAGDNAIVVGALAAGLPARQRQRVIMIGIVAALVLRIGFALMVSWLLGIIGLIFAGGILLLWVAWKMYRELRAGGDGGAVHAEPGVRAAKSFAGAAWAVAVADVSMSLDNVLAVAGAARAHPGILIVGLVLSVALMGIAANLIARYIERFRWIAYLGLLVILYVAGKMIHDGLLDPNVGLHLLF